MNSYLLLESPVSFYKPWYRFEYSDLNEGFLRLSFNIIEDGLYNPYELGCDKLFNEIDRQVYQSINNNIILKDNYPIIHPYHNSIEVNLTKESVLKREKIFTQESIIEGIKRIRGKIILVPTIYYCSFNELMLKGVDVVFHPHIQSCFIFQQPLTVTIHPTQITRVKSPGMFNIRCSFSIS